MRFQPGLFEVVNKQMKSYSQKDSENLLRNAIKGKQAQKMIHDLKTVVATTINPEHTEQLHAELDKVRVPDVQYASIARHSIIISLY